MDREFALAREIQQRLLPEDPPEVKGYELHGSNTASSQVSGDYFDFRLRPDGKVYCAIADVCGKGVGPALLMASLQASFHAWADELVAGLRDDRTPVGGHLPAYGSRSVHHVLPRPARPAGRGDRVHQRGPQPRPPAEEGGAVEELSSHGLPLALFPGKPYGSSKLTLQPGECLYLYTDGLTEANDPEGEEFGLPRLKNCLAGQAGRTPARSRGARRGAGRARPGRAVCGRPHDPDGPPASVLSRLPRANERRMSRLLVEGGTLLGLTDPADCAGGRSLREGWPILADRGRGVPRGGAPGRAGREDPGLGQMDHPGLRPGPPPSVPDPAPQRAGGSFALTLARAACLAGRSGARSGHPRRLRPTRPGGVPRLGRHRRAGHGHRAALRRDLPCGRPLGHPIYGRQRADGRPADDSGEPADFGGRRSRRDRASTLGVGRPGTGTAARRGPAPLRGLVYRRAAAKRGGACGGERPDDPHPRSENLAECALVLHRSGRGNLEHLDEMGLLTDRTCVAHAVHTEEDDGGSWPIPELRSRTVPLRTSASHPASLPSPSSGAPECASRSDPRRGLQQPARSVPGNAAGGLLPRSAEITRSGLREGGPRMATGKGRARSGSTAETVSRRGPRRLRDSGSRGGLVSPGGWVSEDPGAIVFSMGPANVFATIVDGVLRYRASDPTVGGLKPSAAEVRQAVQKMRSRM